MTLPVINRAASEHNQAMTSATSPGSATWCSSRRRGDEGAHLVGDPAGVGDRRVHDVGRDAERGELARRRHRVVLQGRLRRAVRDLLGEAHRPARGQPDDTTPRRAAGEVTTGELGDQERSGTGVDGEVAVDARRRHGSEPTAEPVDARRGERVGHPPAGVVDEDRHRAEPALGLVEHLGGCSVGGEIDLQRDGAPRHPVRGGEHVLGTGRPLALVLVLAGCAGAEVRDEDVHASAGEGDGRRRADAVVGARHDRHARRRTVRTDDDGLLDAHIRTGRARTRGAS